LLLNHKGQPNINNLCFYSLQSDTSLYCESKY